MIRYNTSRIVTEIKLLGEAMIPFLSFASTEKKTGKR